MPSWRNVLLTHVAAGLLGGITLSDWSRLLRENRFAVDPPYAGRALTITMNATLNSALRRREDRRYGSKLKDVAVPPPIFVLGHWRNGTTHLHNLVTTDERFAFPNTFHAFFPHTFLSPEARASRVMSPLMPRQRPMDNVEWGPRTPQEDEFAVCVASLRSPYVGWVFPRHRERYDRYLTLRGLPGHELEQWREALRRFLRKLTWKYDGRPLVLKSPPHTCRIKVLLEMFPQARFVHIHRDPYTVFQSSRKMFRASFTVSGVQRLGLEDVDDWTLRQYRAMYDAFFEERVDPDGTAPRDVLPAAVGGSPWRGAAPVRGARPAGLRPRRAGAQALRGVDRRVSEERVSGVVGRSTPAHRRRVATMLRGVGLPDLRQRRPRADAIVGRVTQPGAGSTHSIRSSARSRNAGGTTRPRDLAVFMLITSSNLIGCSMCSVAGFAPFRILATTWPACCQIPARLGPYDTRPPAAACSFHW